MSGTRNFPECTKMQNSEGKFKDWRSSHPRLTQAPRYRLTPPQKKTMPDGYETPSEHQRRPQPRNGRPMRMSGCRCTQSRVDVGTPTQTPTHGYPEIDPRTHQFSRVRAPVDGKHGGALKKHGGAPCLH